MSLIQNLKDRHSRARQARLRRRIAQIEAQPVLLPNQATLRAKLIQDLTRAQLERSN